MPLRDVARGCRLRRAPPSALMFRFRQSGRPSSKEFQSRRQSIADLHVNIDVRTTESLQNIAEPFCLQGSRRRRVASDPCASGWERAVARAAAGRAAGEGREEEEGERRRKGRKKAKRESHIRQSMRSWITPPDTYRTPAGAPPAAVRMRFM